MTNSFSLTIREAWRNFRSAEGGNVMMTFALAVIPIMGLVGAAVDYSRAGMIRSNMQSAVDATALAVAKSAVAQTPEQIQSAADTYFRALFTRPEASNVQLTTNYDGSNGSTLVVSASATIKADVMGVMGYSQLPIGASSTTKWGNTRLRVALVLDNTGSMLETDSSGKSKISALKTASHNLLTQLKNAAVNNGDVYVSIVPFTTNVTVPSGNWAASWIDWDDWENYHGNCSKSYSTRTSCLNHSGTWTAADRNTWNGCVMDRDQDFDTRNTVPTTTDVSTLFPANDLDKRLSSGYKCPVELMPQSYDWIKLNQKIDDMVAAGGTNQTIGLAWGWQSLSQTSPLSAPAMDANYKYQQVIILLTDGLNTRNRWDGNGSDPSTAVDLRTKAACQNIKNAQITIYTVLVMAGNSSILQECASGTGKYYKLTSPDQIITTFNQIGTELSQLRVAK
jgi:Flp pilus assembly protein TadG